jgi:lysophospholipase L1-like esterase
MAPYTDTLRDMLACDFASVDVLNEGVSGELVTQDFVPRLAARLSRRYAGKHFDYAVVLGGTNDIGWGVYAGTPRAAT